MCVGPAAPLIGLAGTGLSVAGSIGQANSSRTAARVQAETARINADVDMARGNFDANRIATRVDQVLGAQTANLAARGLDPGSGSPLVLSGMSAAQGYVDGAITRAKAGMDAAGQLTAGYAAESRGLDAERAATIGAGASLLTGASRAFGPQSGFDWSKIGSSIGGAFGIN